MKPRNLFFLTCFLTSSVFAGSIPPTIIYKDLANLNITQPVAAKRWKSDQLKAILVAGDRTPNEIIVDNCSDLEKSDYEGRSFDRQLEKPSYKLDTSLGHSLDGYCMNLFVLKNLKPSKESYLGTLDFSKGDWKKLPLYLDNFVAESSWVMEWEQASKNGTTLENWYQQHSHKAVDATKTDIKLVEEEDNEHLFDESLIILARGDFNNDGLEDAVIQFSSSYGRGVDGFGIVVITKKKNDTLFRTLAIWQASTTGANQTYSFIGPMLTTNEKIKDLSNLNDDLSCAGDIISEKRDRFQALYKEKKYEEAINDLKPVLEKCKSVLPDSQKVWPVSDLLLGFSKMKDGTNQCQKFLEDFGTFDDVYASDKAKKALASNRKNCAPPPSKVSGSLGKFIGTWEYKETVTFMQEKPEVMISSVNVQPYQEKLAKINIAINGQHACSAEGIATLSGDKLVYNSSSPKENQEMSDAMENMPCKLEMVVTGKNLKIQSESEGCKAHCGASASFKGTEFIATQKK